MSLPRPVLPLIKLTARDFYKIKDALIEYTKTVFPDVYTDFSVNQIGTMLIELYAYIGDVLSFMIDKTANECFLPTLESLDSALRLSKLLGAPYYPPQSARVRVTINNTNAYYLDALIPEGAELVVPERDLIFCVEKSFTLPAGINYVENAITLVEGRIAVDTFTSNGGALQEFVTRRFSVIQDSVEVKVGNRKWTEVDSLTNHGKEDIYEIEYVDLWKAKIRFGNGINGNIPALGETITITYRTGGGVKGNCNIGEIAGFLPGILTDGTAVSIYVINREPAVGGRDGVSVDNLKILLPGIAKARDTMTTLDDYVTRIKEYFIKRGITALAYAEAGTTNSSVNIIKVWVWLKDESKGNYYAMPPEYAEEVIKYLNPYKLLGVELEVLPGLTKPVNLIVTCKCDEVDTLPNLRTKIESAIQNFFGDPYLKPGLPFYASSLLTYILNNVEGTRVIEIKDYITKQPITSVSVQSNEIYISGLIIVEVQYI